MPRAHDPEVPLIEGGHLDGAQPFGQRDQAGVGATEREVAVALHEVGDAGVVGGGERLDQNVAGGDGAEEAGLGGRPELPVDQVGGLGDDERG